MSPGAFRSLAAGRSHVDQALLDELAATPAMPKALVAVVMARVMSKPRFVAIIKRTMSSRLRQVGARAGPMKFCVGARRCVLLPQGVEQWTGGGAPF